MTQNSPQAPSSALQGLLRSGMWVAVGVMAGRLIGFLREAALAASFGADRAADVAILVLTIPDLLVNILMGGAMSAALIPEFKRLKGVRAACLFVQASLLAAGAFVGLALSCTWGAVHIVRLIAPGFDAASAAWAAGPVAIGVWAIPFTALAGVSTAYLQASERFAVAAFGTLIFNAIVVLALLTVVPASGSPLTWLAGAVILGAMVRWTSQVARAPQLALTVRALRLRLITRPMLVRYAQALAAGGLLLLLPVIARAIASFRDAGALAIINYASKLVELPLGVCVTVLAVVLFPRLAEAFATPGGQDQGDRMLSDGIVLVVVLGCAISIPFMWFAPDVSRLVFGVGKMPESALVEVGALAAIGIVSLPAQGLSSMIVAAFNARRDMAAPLATNLLAIVSFALAGWWAFGAWGLPGLMVAMSAVFYGTAALQVAAYSARWGTQGFGLSMAVSALKTVVVMGLAFIPFAAIGGHLANMWLRTGLAALATGVLLSIGFGLQPQLRAYATAALRRIRRSAGE